MSPKFLHFTHLRKLFSHHAYEPSHNQSSESPRMLVLDSALVPRHVEVAASSSEFIDHGVDDSLDTVRRLDVLGLDGEARSYPPSNIRTQIGDHKPVKSTSALHSHKPRVEIERRPAFANSPPVTPSSTASTFSHWEDSSAKALSSSATSYYSSGRTTPAASTDTQRRRPANAPAAVSSGIVAVEPALETIDEVEKGHGPFTTLVRNPPYDNEEVKLTIRTVENATAAQAYIEKFYSSLYDDLINGSDRNRRKSRFEQQLSHLKISRKDEDDQRNQWARRESAHLRLVRKHKAKTLQDKRHVKQTLCGFEIVRVLGKGSFGVVRLVREKYESSGHRNGQAAPEKSSDDLDSLLDVHRDNSSVWSIEENPKSSKGKICAMKAIRKSDMLRNAQEGHVRAERNFLVQAASSEWIVPLIASFQDKHNLYLVLDYMVGGDFLAYLVREDVLDEKDTAFWIAEMILCIEETHNLGWIHRDIKPDNFLISANGHLKIADFGLSFNGHWAHDQSYYNFKRHELSRRLEIPVKGDLQDQQDDDERMFLKGHLSDELAASTKFNLDLTSQRPHVKQKEKAAALSSVPVLQALDENMRRRFAYSVVGTSQYMAPEVIRGEQYDGRCDWWSAGIILYECLYGHTPFFDENRQRTKENILRHHTHLTFPVSQRYNRPAAQDPGETRPLAPVTNDAIDLILRLLTEKEKRLCCESYKINDIKPDKYNHRRASGRRTSRTGSWGSTMMAGAMKELERVQRFAWPHGASELKKHRFFSMHGIDFATIHHQTPPWVPRTHGDRASTRYFDEEENIIHDEDVSLESDSDSCVSDMDTQDQSVNDPSHPDTVDTTMIISGANVNRGASYKIKSCGAVASAVPPQKKLDHNGRERKRARDKILRDPEHSKQAMHYRKKRAFLGYTWRRPDIWVPSCAAGMTAPATRPLSNSSGASSGARRAERTAGSRGELPPGFRDTVHDMQAQVEPTEKAEVKMVKATA